MSTVASSTQQPIPQSHQEHILVVPRAKLFPHDAWQGLNHAEFDHYFNIIQQHKTFMPRWQAEEDQNYKQIIPYVVFMYQDKLFLMQRTSDASEARLRNKFSLGIGGHIREADITGSSIFAWAQREFYEEVCYTGSMKVTPLGLLNDDSNAVGRVHLGLVLLIDGDSAAISIRSELKSGQLYPIDTCVLFRDSLETWSVTVLDALRSRQAWSMQTP